MNAIKADSEISQEQTEKREGNELLRPVLAAGDDFDDFEAVAGLELALGEFGGRDGFAVVFDNDAAREEVLGD
jgi:hypothetical protein